MGQLGTPKLTFCISKNAKLFFYLKVDPVMVFNAILMSRQENLGAVAKLHTNLFKFRSGSPFSMFSLTSSHLEPPRDLIGTVTMPMPSNSVDCIL